MINHLESEITALSQVPNLFKKKTMHFGTVLLCDMGSVGQVIVLVENLGSPTTPTN